MTTKEANEHCIQAAADLVASRLHHFHHEHAKNRAGPFVHRNFMKFLLYNKRLCFLDFVPKPKAALDDEGNARSKCPTTSFNNSIARVRADGS